MLGQPIDVSGDGGVLKLIKQAGHGGRPAVGHAVTVRFTGKLSCTATQFDASPDDGYTFTLGSNEVIRGWEVGIASMHVGEHAVLTCSPEYAYGPKGSGTTIPPDATLEFDVEVLKSVPKPSIRTLTPAARLELAERERQDGNAEYGAGRLQQALVAYRRGLVALDAIPSTCTQAAAASQLRLTVLLNMAQVHLKLNAFADALSECTSALNIDPSNLKALFRRSKAHEGAGNLEAAEADMATAAAIDPTQVDVVKALPVLRRKLAAQRQSEKTVAARMFATQGKLYPDRVPRVATTTAPPPSPQGFVSRVFSWVLRFVSLLLWCANPLNWWGTCKRSVATFWFIVQTIWAASRAPPPRAATAKRL